MADQTLPLVNDRFLGGTRSGVLFHAHQFALQRDGARMRIVTQALSMHHHFLSFYSPETSSSAAFVREKKTWLLGWCEKIFQ